MLSSQEMETFAQKHGDGVPNGVWWIFHDGAAMSQFEVREPPSDPRDLLLMRQLYWETKASNLTQDFYRHKSWLTESARGGVMAPTQAQIDALAQLRSQATEAQQRLEEVNSGLADIGQEDLAVVTKLAKQRDKVKRKHKIAAEKAEQARAAGDAAEAARLAALVARLRTQVNDFERQWRALKNTHARAMRQYMEQQAQSACWEAARQIETMEL